jgi:hypothetical protein
MRAELLFIGAIVIAVCGLLTRGRRRRPPTPLLGRLTDRIDVKVKWNGNSLDIDIDPACAEIPQGQEVSWYHDVESLMVVPKPVAKDRAPWPFVDKEPPEAGKGKPVNSGPMETNPVLDKAYGYTLVMRVARPNGSGIQVIRLDPDIIIRDDRTTEKFT